MLSFWFSGVFFEILRPSLSFLLSFYPLRAPPTTPPPTLEQERTELSFLALLLDSYGNLDKPCHLPEPWFVYLECGDRSQDGSEAKMRRMDGCKKTSKSTRHKDDKINVSALFPPPDHHFPHYFRTRLPARIRREQLLTWKGRVGGVNTFREAQERWRRWVRRVFNEFEAPKGGYCICVRERWGPQWRRRQDLIRTF